MRLKKEQWTMKEDQLKQHWLPQADPPWRKMEAKHSDWGNYKLHWKRDLFLRMTPGSTKKRELSAEDADGGRKEQGSEGPGLTLQTPFKSIASPASSPMLTTSPKT